jgi:hypothetical protein
MFSPGPLSYLTFRVIASLAASAACLSAGQFTLVEFFSAGLDGNLNGPGPDFGSVTGPTTASFSTSSTATDGSYKQTVSGAGSASITTLRASSSETLTCQTGSCGSYALPFSSAEGSSANYQPGISTLVWWNDIMTVNTTGPVANLQFVFNLNGTLSQTGNGVASASLVGESCDATQAACSAGIPRHNTNVPITANGPLTINLTPWVLNQPFEYEFILVTNAFANPTGTDSQGFITGTGSATADYYDTAQLVSVLPVDSQGNYVPGTTITSASGVILPVAVPEPSTLGLAFTGLLLAGACRRFRSSPHRRGGLVTRRP